MGTNRQGVRGRICAGNVSRLVVTASVVAMATGCGEGITVPTEPPSVEGTVLFWVSDAQPPTATPGISIRIERSDPPCQDITVETVRSPERFVKRLPDGSLAAAALADFEEGQVIRAWTESAVGCPFIGPASVVEIEVG